VVNRRQVYVLVFKHVCDLAVYLSNTDVVSSSASHSLTHVSAVLSFYVKGNFKTSARPRTLSLLEWLLEGEGDTGRGVYSTLCAGEDLACCGRIVIRFRLSIWTLVLMS
jgi:hypothetical protein